MRHEHVHCGIMSAADNSFLFPDNCFCFWKQIRNLFGKIFLKLVFQKTPHFGKHYLDVSKCWKQFLIENEVPWGKWALWNFLLFFCF